MYLQVCVWINSYIAQESKLFDEGAEKGYFVKRGDGSVWQYDFWVRRATTPSLSYSSGVVYACTKY
jgi:alpha-glucosidase (family GH31 glycosyl hydrolase)